MEFRFPVAVAETNASYRNYLTKELKNPEAGKAIFDDLLDELGNTVSMYPEWHPILTLAPQKDTQSVTDPSQLPIYKGMDHTVRFVKGFVTCPYSEATADQLVSNVNSIYGLRAYRLEHHLYSDHAFPVVVRALNIELEGDGTIRSRDALAWCVQQLVKDAHSAQVAETWWTMKSSILGQPHGSRSSILVNQYTGGHMRKILEALNNSGLYGPIRELSLDMLTEKKKKKISETLIRAALQVWDKTTASFQFELHGETCKAEVNDTWKDGEELYVRVIIGDFELYTSGYYYPNKSILQAGEPKGKKSLADKFCS